jgi:hypothetical protein
VQFDPWVNIADATNTGAFASFLTYFSWVLLLPAPCLLQCLLGFMIYPAVTEAARKQESIAEQLQAEAQMRPQSLAARSLFKIHFRIVTRGNNPNLVLSNCQDALKVLQSSGLPESRFKVDVVTDNRIEILSEVPQVDQIVVPADYAPPGGCKYKARALNTTTGLCTWTRRRDSTSTRSRTFLRTAFGKSCWWRGASPSTPAWGRG